MLLWCQPVVVVGAPPWPILEVPLELPQVIQKQNDHEEDESTGGTAASATAATTSSPESKRREPDAPIIESRLYLLCDQVSPKQRSEETAWQVPMEAHFGSAPELWIRDQVYIEHQGCAECRCLPLPLTEPEGGEVGPENDLRFVVCVWLAQHVMFCMRKYQRRSV